MKANTLVVADTVGFHARGFSARPSRRVEIWAYGRRNPFLPWTGLDPLSLPGIAEARIPAMWRSLDALERMKLRGNPWRDVGLKRPQDDPGFAGFAALMAWNRFCVPAISLISHSRNERAGADFLRALGAHDPVAAVVLQVEAEGPGQPALVNRVGAENLIAEREALPRLRRFDGEVVLERGAAPVFNAGDARGGEPFRPPLLAAFVQQIVVRQIGGLQGSKPGDQFRRAYGEDLHFRQLHRLRVGPGAAAVADAEIGLAGAEVHQPRGGVDVELDVGMHDRRSRPAAAPASARRWRAPPRH